MQLNHGHEIKSYNCSKTVDAQKMKDNKEAKY